MAFFNVSLRTVARLAKTQSTFRVDLKRRHLSVLTRSICTTNKRFNFPPTVTRMSNSKNSGLYDTAFVLPPQQPVVALDAKVAFEKLTEREKLYAHYLSRASFFGGLIVLVQTSPEAPHIFRLIQRINRLQGPTELQEDLKDHGVSEDDVLAYSVYCSGIYTNMGNYKGFGDSKFVPDLAPENFERIVKHSKAWAEDPEAMSDLWTAVKDHIWSLSERETQLGLGKMGISTYFSANCTQEDADKVNRFFKANNMEGYNNRVFKTISDDGQELFEIRNAAKEKKVPDDKIDFEGSKFVVTVGDYGRLLELVNQNLQEAKKYVANGEEEKMLEYYINSFETGSLDAHKDGSRHWIMNKSPSVETYIGFIETYRDPVGMRGEFEGFVAMVNKDQSAKFQELVENAEKFLPHLPWPQGFEKDRFLRPDFTSLDVLTFTGSGIPAGINIPNYDEIRQSEGFKNVNLGNVVSASLKSTNLKQQYVSHEDHELLEKYHGKSFEVQVGLHELLGHGSGKLFQVSSIGKANYEADQLKDPLTNQLIDPKTVYQQGDTYDSVFTSLGSAYEECRAECVGLHLSCNSHVLKIFGLDAEGDDVTYVNWLSMCQKGVGSLEMFSPSSGQWKQAHSQARFVILRVLLEAGEDFVTVKQVTGEDGHPDLFVSMDRKKLNTVGQKAISDFLLKLQVYKSTANIAEATKMFDHYSAVTSDDPAFPWPEWRDIVLARKRPRKMFVQANTIIKDESLNLIEYDSSHEGMIKSWRERFTTEEHKLNDNILKELVEFDQVHFSKRDF